MSRSTDGGCTWDAPSEVTREREHPADLTLLSNDWVLMVYGVRREPFGVQARVSKDSWPDLEWSADCVRRPGEPRSGLSLHRPVGGSGS